MADKCNCSDEHCKGDKSTHIHDAGNCIHADGTKHPIHGIH